jgi:hypothetical protein
MKEADTFRGLRGYLCVLCVKQQPHALARPHQSKIVNLKIDNR